MKDVIICISREYGSGGKELAIRLSKRLGIPFYDKELLERVTKESHMNEEFVKDHEESAQTQHFFGIPLGHGITKPDAREVMTPKRLFEIQTQEIQRIAKEEKSCIFLGRCADVILQGDPRCRSVFVHSPVEQRVKRLMETEQMSDKEARRMIKKTDNDRSSYHNFYTGLKWGHPTNYDLIINSARLGMDRTENILCKYIEE